MLLSRHRRPAAHRLTRGASRGVLGRLAAGVAAAVGATVVAATFAPAPPAAAQEAWFQPGSTWTGDFGDPTVVRVGGTYYAYASPVGGRVLPVLSSTDLKNWTVRGRYSTGGGVPGRGNWTAGIPAEILNSPQSDWAKFDNNDALVRHVSWGQRNDQGGWINRDYWAPGVFNIGSTWFAYSPVRVAPSRFCLTVASAPSPQGPFRDISGNGPIQCEDPNVDPGGSIDPMPYRDPATGKNYLLWKASGKINSHPSAIKSVELGNNGFPLPGARVTTLLTTERNSAWEGNTIENPSMVNFRGTTYLFYSGNLSDPLDGAGRSNYASGYAWCPNGPTAPCQRLQSTPLLSSSGSAQGPGGSSGFVDAGGNLKMAYATFRLGENVGGWVPHPRRMSIASLVQSADLRLRVDGAAPAAANPIASKWNSLGGAGGVLGNPTTPVLDTPRRPGSYQHFQGGSVYFSSVTGAHVVKGLIRDRWAAWGWENSSLGFPLNDEIRLRSGAYSLFQDGSIYWSPATGAHVVKGLVRDKWAAQGWENGYLGYPTTDEIKLPGGAFSHFQGGSVYWSPATGTHAVRGAIRSAWAQQGWETGRLGYPTSDEYDSRGGKRTDFQGGSIFWSPGTGTVVTYR
ncbi:family 43 glycosylhydrolase [Kineococcus gynurae]|uniref:Family 43 glycosylhydrolase n=1 Tax=Kineococcus gynurae TaxID=452979 RepID=A0ABV5LRI7_9ACTN